MYYYSMKIKLLKGQFKYFFVFIALLYAYNAFSHEPEGKNKKADGIREMQPMKYNFQSFSIPQNFDPVKQDDPVLNSKKLHPESGVIPYNGPEGNWIEHFDKRTENERYFTSPLDPSKFSMQKSLGALHFMKDGFWQTIDPRIRKTQENLFEANLQPQPVGFNTEIQNAYIYSYNHKVDFNRWKLYGVKNSEKIFIANANWQNFSAGDDGIEIKNIFNGIDAQMIVNRGHIKTNFIIKELVFDNFDYLVFEDEFSALGGETKLEFAEASNLNEANGEVYFKLENEELLHIGEAFGYAQNSSKETNTSLTYKINQNRLSINVSVDWIKMYIYHDHVVIDPPVTSTQALAQPFITGSQFNATCNFVNSCNHTLTITPPASAVINGLTMTFNYVAVNPCRMDDGALRFSLGTCNNPSQNGVVLTCNNPAPGTCNGTNPPIPDTFTNLGSCLPTPSCNPTPLTFTMRFFRSCFGASGCNNTCVGAGSPWTITINGNTLNVGNATATGGTSNICQGQTANLIANGQNGVAPYTYVWNPGNINGQTASVTPNTTTPYTVTITDACGTTATQNVTINVTQNNNPNFTISPSPACAGQPITVSGLGTGPANSYDWQFPSASSSSVNNQQVVNGLSYASSGNYNLTLNYQQGACVFPITNSLTVNPLPAPPVLSSNEPICIGQTLQLQSNAIAGATYSWTGPNGFVSNLQNPQITNATAAAGGTYQLTISQNGCTSSSSIDVTVINAPLPPTISSSGPLTICSGQNITLTASAANGYLWSNGATTQSITVSAAGTYSVQVSNLQGCISPPSASVSVVENNIPPTPVITPNGPTAFCAGNSVVLSAPNSSSYLWSTGATTQTITVSTSGSYTVQVTNSSGCVSPVSMPLNVVVNPSPAIPLISGGPLNICQGSSVTLSGPGGFNYSWSNGSTDQEVILNTGQTISLTITDNNGCSSTSNPVTVALLPLPAVPAITSGGSTNFCQGGSVTLSAPAGFTYQWTSGQTSQSITVNTSGIYGVTITDANNCSVSSVNNINVNVFPLPPAPTISSSNGNMVCQGGNTVLTASQGSSYLWNTGATTQSITVSATGNYTVSVTNANGCTSPASAAFTFTVVASLPPPVPTLNGSPVLCQGENITITAPPATAYLWSNGSTTQSITVQNAGSYTVSITDNTGCTSPPSNPVVVTVNALPQVSISASGPTSFCQGGSVTITANNIFSTYQWSNGSNTQSITVNQSGAYNLVVTDVNGCSSTNSNTLNVTVHPIPQAPVINASSSFICQGQTATLSAPNAAQYNWSNGETTQSINVSQAGSYTLSITDNNGCVSPVSAAVVLTVQPLPATPSIAVSGPTSFCSGGSVTLSATAGFTSYIWSPSSGNADQINVTSSGNYTVQVVDNNGCTSLASAAVNVTVFNNPPQPVIQANGPLNFCNGSSVELFVTQQNVNYLWSTGQVTSTITVEETGSFWVQFTDLNGCVSPQSDAINVIEFGEPPVPTLSSIGVSTVCTGQTVTLASSSGASYIWNPPAADAQTIEVSAAGNYTVSIIDANGCPSAPSSPITVTLLPLPPSPTISANGPTLFCFGNSVELVSSESLGNLWNTGATTSSITVSQSGNYSVQVLGANGCYSLPSSSVSVIVNTPPPPPTLSNSGPLSFCEGSSVVLTVDNGISYLWNNGSTLQSQEFNESQTVSVVVTDACGLIHTLNANINSIPKPFVDFTASNISGCAPLKVEFLNLANGYSTLRWDFGDGNISNELNPNYEYKNAGEFTVTLFAINDLGCFNFHTKPLYVNVLPKPTSDFRFEPEKIKISEPTVNFLDMSSNDVVKRKWIFAEPTDTSILQNPFFTYNDTGDYRVKLWVQNEFGCTDTSSVSIRIDGDLIIYVPNVFSPNNDGINDVFLPRGTYIDSKNFSLKIFNRWGDLVFETDNLNEGWDGNIGFDKLKHTNIYYWQIELKDKAGQNHLLSGSVTLIH